MRYYPLDEQAAREAHEMNHFGPFRSDEPAYRAEVDEAYKAAEKAAQKNPEQRGRAYVKADRFAQGLADWYNKGYSIDSMCPSVLIAGPANFPTHKKEKQNRARDAHCKELEKLTRLKESIVSIGDSGHIIKLNDENAAKKLEEKIERLTKKQEAMKAANAKARKDGKQAPFLPFSLSNNSQNIRAAKKRLASLQAVKDDGTKRQSIEFMGESVEVVENAELMRLQLLFEGKPSEEAREALKRNGFRWSPKQGAWQRQLTANARFALRFMLKAAAE